MTFHGDQSNWTTMGVLETCPILNKHKKGTKKISKRNQNFLSESTRSLAIPRWCQAKTQNLATETSTPVHV